MPQVRKELESVYAKVCKDYGDDAGLLPVQWARHTSASAVAGRLTDRRGATGAVRLGRQVVWRAIQEQLVAFQRHWSSLIERCYPQSGIALDFSIEDILTLTNDIAASASAPRG